MMDMGMDRLMTALLDRQDDGPAFDAAALVDAILVAQQSGQPLASQWQTLLWQSPPARRLFRQMKRARKAELQARWLGLGLDFSMTRMAASENLDGRPETISTRGFQVTTAQDAGSGRWLISLQLESSALANMPPGLKVTLVDEGGLDWLTGAVDDMGGIDGWWAHDGSPRDRLGQFGLTLRLS